ncbi:AcrR family transcriptional regulator [Streptomonospora nanhaiensis]|uniref:AcrR family transcriptional regulator n=2 Tax=Streptomonospora nanhaiensis TaxID=1323731 RepID=A0A853BQ33_9ACTN|nr:AcrR family transcriptional regulator [Streptomonospora nanhaiensis]
MGAVEPSLAYAPLRRLPAQHRSMVRVQRMLDACAELLDEGGYSELSTTRIAERAGVAIGSVYQFFPDKKAITQALGLRYLDQFTARVAERLAEGGREHWTHSADVIIDEYLDMHRTVPGFRSLHFGDVVDERLLDSDTENNRVIATRLRQLLTAHGGAHECEQLDRAVVVAVEAADAVLKLAFRLDPDGDPRLIEETKLLLRTYLGHHFG